MIGFRIAQDGTVSGEFEPVEAALLTQLAGQVAGLMADASEERAGHDPAITRLLPDAYRDDPEAAAEFRRFTVDDLTSRKIRNAQVIIASVADALVADRPTRVDLDPAATQAWLRALTDMRLVIATRLGIEHDGEVGTEPDADATLMLSDLYDWLGGLQEALVRAVDR